MLYVRSLELIPLTSGVCTPLIPSPQLPAPPFYFASVNSAFLDSTPYDLCPSLKMIATTPDHRYGHLIQAGQS